MFLNNCCVRLRRNLLLAAWLLACVAIVSESAALPGSAAEVDVRSISCGRAPKQPARSALEQAAEWPAVQASSPFAAAGKQKAGLPAEVVQKVVRSGFASYRSCYEAALRPCPNLQGRVTVHFTIEPKTGRVSHARAESDLAGEELHRCVAGKFKELQFPSFEGPAMKVVYPISFTPGG